MKKRREDLFNTESTEGTEKNKERVVWCGRKRTKQRARFPTESGRSFRGEDHYPRFFRVSTMRGNLKASSYPIFPLFFSVFSVFSVLNNSPLPRVYAVKLLLFFCLVDDAR